MRIFFLYWKIEISLFIEWVYKRVVSAVCHHILQFNWWIRIDSSNNCFYWNIIWINKIEKLRHRILSKSNMVSKFVLALCVLTVLSVVYPAECSKDAHPKCDWKPDCANNEYFLTVAVVYCENKILTHYIFCCERNADFKLEYKEKPCKTDNCQWK